jgi:hypothetical protein
MGTLFIRSVYPIKPICLPKLFLDKIIDILFLIEIVNLRTDEEETAENSMKCEDV